VNKTKRNFSKVFCLYLPVVSILVFMIVANVNAQNLATTKIAATQQVIVDKQNADGSAKPLGGSGFYVSDFKNADGVKYPIKSYKAQLVVNDPYEPQYYTTLLDAPTLWDSTVDATGLTIAVIDGGFALTHEDLVGRWATNDLEIGATVTEGAAPNCTSRALPLDKSCNNIDDDSNGYVDDWQGWDFANSDNDLQAGTTAPTSTYVGHGTEVAGLLGSTGNNSLGAASMNWQSKILPIQILTDDGIGSTVELAEGISYAIDMGVDVISLSLGSSGIDPTVEALLSDANDAGIVVVSSAGNCGGSTYAENGCDYEGQMLYPATSDYVISVAATDDSDVQAPFSSRGTVLDISAPGFGAMYDATYLSTNETAAYVNEMYGTSFSTPIVSGIVALLKAEWPTATNNDIRSLLVDTAYKPAGMSGQVSTTKYGFGRVEPVDALAMATSCKTITLKSDYNCDGGVTLLDLSLLASQWQKQYTGRTDSNESGTVDLSDLSLLASQWGQ
jgi:subtilisin family serine protease